MARPRSEEKQANILDAARRLIAEQGISVSTSLIARGAGVAEGTVFRYFPTKQQLLNSLYIDLKRDLRASVGSDSPESLTLDERARLSWDRHVQWGVANQVSFRALNALELSDVLTSATRAEVIEMFPESGNLSVAYTDASIAATIGPAYVDMLFQTLVDMTISLTLREPELADRYRDAGFALLWSATGH